ncbi:MAG: leucyl aminopeptidase [Jatrophihabitans sp.]|uniref:leucyl aminopeptidase n=1 Tax=Jatrophihabitans sp. TaxID=1932789 RepID=UPI003F812198
MPTISVQSPTKPVRADAVVVGVFSGPGGLQLAPGAEAVDGSLGGRLREALVAAGASGRPDEITKIPTLGLSDVPLVVATGLGERTEHGETFRRAVGAALRAVSSKARVHIALDAPVGPVVEGALLGSYAFTEYKSAPAATALRTITVPGGSRAELTRARVIAEAVNFTRDLVNTPPNDLYPATFAERVAARGAKAGLEVEVLDERALKRGRFGGILGVGQGSTRPPRLVRLSYRPARARRHLALVGKGITFDSGGLNLKTVNLTWMKSDMGGAAAAASAICAAAALKLPVRITATLPMAENMPSGSSYRPSDVLTMHSGRTVEVADTDAEGRLILADGISRALQDGPDALVELSTLTGAQLVALGPRLIGVMGEESMRDTVVAAAGECGEDAWPMPLPEHLRAGLDSAVADLQNVPGERWGGMLVAGRFLQEFVPADLPWAHLDIAGPAYNNGGPRDYTPKGGTGAGVRTLIATAERLAAG